MSNKYNTAYFENDEQLYKERQDYLYKDPQDQRDSLFIALNINDLFFKPLGAEITSILETNKDLSLEFFVFINDGAAPTEHLQNADIVYILQKICIYKRQNW